MPQFFRIVFFVGDLIFLNGAVIASYRITHTDSAVENVNMTYLLIFSNLAWLFLIIISNPYNFSRNWGALKFLRNQVSYVVVHLFVVGFLILFFKKTYSPVLLGIVYLIFIPIFFGWKLLVAYLLASFSEKEVTVRNMIIVGEGNLVRDVRKYFLVHSELKYRFMGAFAFPAEMEKIRNFCDHHQVHEIFCCIPHIRNYEFRDLIDFGLNRFIRVKLINNSGIDTSAGFSLEKEDQLFVADRAVVPLDEPVNRVVKRVFDLIFSSAVIVLVLSWLVPLIGMLIKLDSRGGIFFVQKRGGLNNQPFDCLKFRTMVIHKEADHKQATKDDPRITRIGKFLRKSSLDEFPQFINVFLGQMSLIGPRPHPLKLNEEFSVKIEGLMARHYVKPGLTGLAQSMGYRGETKNIIDMENRIAMDRFYIENWSMWLDVKIIFRTVISLVKGSENAY